MQMAEFHTLVATSRYTKENKGFKKVGVGQINWEYIGEKLNRRPKDCLNKYIRFKTSELAKTMKKGPFTPEEASSPSNIFYLN